MVHGEDAASNREAEGAAIRRRTRLVYELKGRVEQEMELRLAVPIDDLLQNVFLKTGWR